MSGPLAQLGAAQRAGRLPAMSAALVRDGRLSWAGSVGEARGPRAGEVLDTQFRIGSITKTFTAVLLHQAAREGLVSLDEPLSTYVPEAPFGDRTLAALLSHTSGIPKEPRGPWWERHQGGSFAALVTANAGAVPMSGPGVEFRYSNLGFGLLGEAAARVLGADWWSLVRTRILDPLEMTRTTYQATAPHAQGWSVSHLLGTLTPEPHTDTGAMAPAGQLWSTLTNLATYAGFLLAGHPDVLPLGVLEEASVEALPDSGYGLGFRRVPYDGGVLVGHTGTMPGFMAALFVDRSRGTAFAGLANGTLGQESAALAVAMLEAIDEDPGDPGTPWTPTSDVPDDVRALVGTWYWGETAFELRWDSDELQLVQTRPGEAYEEYVRQDGRWIGTDRTELEVVRRADGSLDHLVSETYVLTRTPYAG